MLLNFRVANHRSIREEQALQLHPVYDADRPAGSEWRAVPVAGIFGANAAGKSNVVDALQYMARMVLNSHRDAEPDQGVSRKPFRLARAALAEPSWYVVDVLLRGVRYTYGFCLDDERVLDEWLYSYPYGRKRKIFHRSGENVETGDSQPKSALKLVESITESNVLFISLAARSKQREVRPVYDWFRSGLHFRTDRSFSSPRSMAKSLETSARAPHLLDLLRAADLGIEDCGVDSVELDVADIRSLPRRTGSVRLRRDEDGNRCIEEFRPWVAHRGRDEVVKLDLHEESSGTRALIEQAPHFLSVLKGGGTFVVDEIDSSLHPLLTTRLVKLFQSTETNPHGAQLVFTTHDASLLGRSGGEDILKRDQVWFVQKDQYGETEIFALSEFKPRQDENRERRYLGGSYGGVPFIDDSFVNALAARGENGGQDSETEREQAPFF
jgi:uncharacterized protein